MDSGSRSVPLRTALRNFAGRQDLAARDAAHVGDEAFDLADAALFQPLCNIVIGLAVHDRCSCRRLAERREDRARQFVFRPAPFGMPLHAEQKRLSRPASRRPRSVPSGAMASACSDGASRSMPCECSEFTWKIPRAHDVGEQASRLNRNRMRRAHIAVRAARPCPRGDRSGPGTSCTC